MRKGLFTILPQALLVLVLELGDQVKALLLLSLEVHGGRGWVVPPIDCVFQSALPNLVYRFLKLGLHLHIDDLSHLIALSFVLLQFCISNKVILFKLIHIRLGSG